MADAAVLTTPAETGPASALRRVTRSATTTPGRLSVLAIGLVVLTLATGLIAAWTLQDKRDTVEDIVTQREPLAAAAQQLYRSLSDADATAASAFLSGGAEPQRLRDRYEFDIAQAGAALGRASADAAGDPSAEQQVSVLSQQLPVYTGLIETARANNRQGFPAGAAYLREASGLMRAKLLPAAEQLYGTDYRRLTEEQAEARSFPWFTLLLTLILLGALAATQRYLTRRTNRVLNVGLVVATAAVLVGLLWSTVALLIGSSYVAAGERNGSRQVDVLVQARINALKCRADETLTLVARGDGPGYEREWADLSTTLTGGEGNLLAKALGLASSPEIAGDVQQAVSDADAWIAAHQRIRDLDDSGQYEEAVKMAIGDAPNSAATAFGRLDENLIKALGGGRAEFVDQTSRATNATTLLVPGVAVLGLVAAAGVAVGIRERLREYR